MRKRVKESLQKSLIRLLVGIALLVLGSLAPVANPYGPCPVYAATQPHAGAKLLGVVW
jgi:hypothetical protein